MQMISTRTHGFVDYVVGIILLIAPYVLGFADGTAAQWVPMALGAATIIYSLLTDYELGAVRVLPMPVHLALDGLSGLLLLTSPWLFGFADRVFWPHLVIGIFEIVASITTRREPEVRSGPPLNAR